VFEQIRLEHQQYRLQRNLMATTATVSTTSDRFRRAGYSRLLNFGVALSERRLACTTVRFRVANDRKPRLISSSPVTSSAAQRARR
jgi:hypothetical protein